MICWPVVSWTVVVMVCQLTHPSSIGNVNSPVTLTPPKSTLNVPPVPGEATRRASW